LVVALAVAGRRLQLTLLLASVLLLRTPPSHCKVVNGWLGVPICKLVFLVRLKNVAGVTAARAAEEAKLPSWDRPLFAEALLRVRPSAGLRRAPVLRGTRVKRTLAPRRSNTGISPFTNPVGFAALLMASLMAVFRALSVP